MQTYSKLFINGSWQTPDSQRHIDVVNPSNNEICVRVPAANNNDIDKAVAAAKGAFPSFSTSSALARSKLIESIADEMQKRADELAKAIAMTMGCPEHLSKDIQVQGSINALRKFASMTHVIEQTSELKNHTQYHSPIGVCVLINPWNYPLSQLVGKLGPALATGCTVVVKPAEQTPLQDIIMAEIFDKVAPKGIFNLITAVGSEVGKYLCSHPDVDMVSFTGSTAAGIKVAQAAAPSVKRVCQELGGKSPFIITKDADLEQAVRYGVEDVMINSGQTCCALTRMLVPKSKYLQAIKIAKAVAEENLVAEATNEDASMGPLSSKLQQERVLEYIKIGMSEGAELVTGGLELPEHLSQGAFVMPTIFANVTNSMRIAREEIFGPVLCMIAYQDEEEAIAIANDTDFGLSSSVYAKDQQSAIAIGRKLRAGQCYVQGSYFNSDTPFGGFKQSGNGREWGEEGLREFMELQSIITH